MGGQLVLDAHLVVGEVARNAHRVVVLGIAMICAVPKRPVLSGLPAATHMLFGWTPRLADAHVATEVAEFGPLYGPLCFPLGEHLAARRFAQGCPALLG